MASMRASHLGKRSSGSGDPHEDCGKYTRYTAEQVELLEKVYAECPKPNLSHQQQMICDYPILSNLEPKQIKIWFQNRRCRERQKKEAINFQLLNRKLTAVNKLLTEENDRLQKQVSHLVCENEYIHQQLKNKSPATTDTSCGSSVNSPQLSLRAANDPTGILSVAEEIMAEFLSKAIGTAIDWVRIPGMKPGPDPVGTVYISHNCTGVAARACGLVSLEPTSILEILKDWSSWFQDCRNLEVFAKFPAGNGGTIELIYTQFYALTTLVPARDFWTLRYTSTFEDGSIVVCEKSISDYGTGPNPFVASQLTRAKMLASGYFVRPFEGGGSTIHIVDHLDLEALTAPEELRPLYESSKLVAQKMTVAALHYIRRIARERSCEVGHGKEPPLRTFSQRLSRGFNDAVSGFNNDGWSLMSYGSAEDLVISINTTKNFGTISYPVDPQPLVGGILCVKASTLLPNVSSALLVRFLREHRTEWADLSIDAYSAASLKAGSFALPGSYTFDFSSSSMLLGHTVDDEEILEMIRLEGRGLSKKNSVLFQDIHLLQICNGVEDNAIGACSELIFAPINSMLRDDAPLLSSGFRVLPLDSTTCHRLDMMSPQRITNLLSNLKVTSHEAGSSSSSNDSKSVLIVAFQFPFENHLLEEVATMAREYIVKVISSVQRVAWAIQSPGLIPHVGLRLTAASPEAVTLANWICHSYSSSFGAELLRSSCQSGDSVLKQFWYHRVAIICCSVKSLPICLFANGAALDMLETTLVALQDTTLHQIFDKPGLEALSSIIPKIMHQGFVLLSNVTCVSLMGRHVSYEKAIAWKVCDEGGAVYCLAFAFTNGSFL
ncbi:homeobox-leucine zipper protein REVOLUTA-like [Camellia sinensis]|uniref:homeobox-leucine zipper protein REVOLUTA-like n=1 Tax=Camellia sinensis TaxID=4442 RepID=UPI0010366A53|nr:homeobox-leucine zipper protein REVOLUTA-like [Camellia sinensis]